MAPSKAAKVAPDGTASKRTNEMFIAAAAVGLKAMEQGVARKSSTKIKLIENATKPIHRARRQTKVMIKEGVIAPVI